MGTIKSEILKLAKQRREKRLKLLLTDDEYAQLMQMALKQNLNMCDVIRNKVFKNK